MQTLQVASTEYTNKRLRTLFPGYGSLGQLGDIVDANEKEANTFLENF